MSARPITEEDLHGYIDRVLDPAREAEVSAYLVAHPDVATRINGYAQQRTDLRAALAPIADEPLPPELDLARMIARQRRPRQTSWGARGRGGPSWNGHSDVRRRSAQRETCGGFARRRAMTLPPTSFVAVLAATVGRRPCATSR